MTNVGSLPETRQSVFDFETHEGITHVLASVRASKISSEQKNELRDLIFLYSNGDRDKRVLGTLEQKIQAYAITPVPRKVSKSKTIEQPTIGKFRFAPSFSITRTEIPSVETAVKKPDFTSDEAWKKEPVPTPVVEKNPTPTVSEPIPASADPAPSQPVQTSVPPPMPASPPEPVAATETVVSDSQQQALERIREIKAIVNEKVGNPVNLVDINNEVGREYMGALLDAMKKINTGSAAASAMVRLEKALEAVEETLKNRASDSSVKAPVHAVSTTPTSVASKQQVKVNTEPSAPEPAQTPISVESTPQVSTRPQSPIKEASQVPPTRSGRMPIEDISEKINQIKSNSVKVKSSVPPREPHKVEQTSGWDTPVATETPTAPTAQATPSTPASGIKPLASLADLTKPVATPTQPKSTPSPSAPTGDSLFTAEIDSGLEQLLEEWPIFKKSGLFGTGPKGREHPLFKKMAVLQIPLLLAGRFEGATQEIKQSVTDYMNGWRYEQGLIYEQGETFEHYLRRVIRHILDLQKNKL